MSSKNYVTFLLTLKYRPEYLILCTNCSNTRLKRIHLSFSKKGTKTLTLLETQNRKLRELLDSSDKLDTLKIKRKDTTWGTIFECIRRHASSLHMALTNGWQCDCASPHSAGLRLQHRTTGGWSSSFNMSFAVRL